MIVDLAQWVGLESAGYIFLKSPWNRYFGPLIHGTVVPFWSGQELVRPTDETSSFTEEHKLIAQFSRSYFIFDLIKLINDPITNTLFIVHHLITLIVLHLFEKHRQGYMLLQILFWGELTNPLYNIRAALSKSRSGVIYRCVNHVFTWLFLYIRLVRLPMLTSTILSTFCRRAKDSSNNDVHIHRDYNRLKIIAIGMHIANGVWSAKLLKQYFSWIRSKSLTQ